MKNFIIKFRQDSSDNWNLFNPVLKPGEIAVDIDKMSFKIGDGVTEWKDLSYFGDAAVFNGAHIYLLNDEDKPSVTFVTNIEKEEENKNDFEWITGPEDCCI